MGLTTRGRKRGLLLFTGAVAGRPFMSFAMVSAEINRPLSPVKSFPYLYGVEGNPNASYPVMDHLSLSYRPDYDQDQDVENDRPDFLFTATGTYRMVEFYVHWCDVCKNFKPHYIQLGRRIQQLAGANTTVEVHAVSCAPNRPLCKALSIDRYPYFRVFQPGDASGVDVPHAQVNPVTILRKMGIAVDEEADDWHVDISSSITTDASPTWFVWGLARWEQWTTKAKAAGKFGYKRSRDELRDDVHLSFDYAMRQGVFISNDPLAEKRAATLFAWLVLLGKTLPVSWTGLHAAVQGLMNNFDYVRRSEDYMISIIEEHPPASSVWSMACSHGEVDAGYTCGLWELFHVITVGVVDYNRAAVFARNRLATESVARAIRNYVDAFFGCEVCRHNFVTAFDACAYRRCERLVLNTTGTEADWIQLPLWLFETHNAVNVRLMTEKAVREHRPAPTVHDEKAVTWPPVRDCPQCWLDEKWNDDVVYKYLKLEYGQHDFLSSEYKQELFAPAIVVEPSRALELKQGDDWWTLVIRWIPAKFVPFKNNAQQPPRRTLNDLRADVHLSFDYAMRMEVYNTLAGPLTDQARMALRDWLNLLGKTIPASWTTMHSLIKELQENFMYVAKSSDYLTAVLDDYLPEHKEWTMTCSHGKAGAGYTCGLWEILHVITVGVVQHNKLVASSDGERLATAKVARTIRNYVDHFFKREVGRQEFLLSFDMCEHDRCDKLLVSPGTEADWVHLPLWMYELHNSVNVRLMKEEAANGNREATRDDEIVVQWPSSTECPRCWLDYGRWDADMVYKYLLLEYGPQNVLTTGLREELFAITASEDQQEL